MVAEVEGDEDEVPVCNMLGSMSVIDGWLMIDTFTPEEYFGSVPVAEADEESDEEEDEFEVEEDDMEAGAYETLRAEDEDWENAERGVVL